VKWLVAVWIGAFRANVDQENNLKMRNYHRRMAN
jgi:hypothetical protein